MKDEMALNKMLRSKNHQSLILPNLDAMRPKPLHIVQKMASGIRAPHKYGVNI